MNRLWSHWCKSQSVDASGPISIQFIDWIWDRLPTKCFPETKHVTGPTLLPFCGVSWSVCNNANIIAAYVGWIAAFLGACLSFMRGRCSPPWFLKMGQTWKTILAACTEVLRCNWFLFASFVPLQPSSRTIFRLCRDAPLRYCGYISAPLHFPLNNRAAASVASGSMLHPGAGVICVARLVICSVFFFFVCYLANIWRAAVLLKWGPRTNSYIPASLSRASLVFHTSLRRINSLMTREIAPLTAPYPLCPQKEAALIAGAGVEKTDCGLNKETQPEL